jgi:pyrimidine-nucleoside phosphorylase
MSGRGLGHTGGTLDKLESIPGMRIELAPDEFIQQVADVGIAVIAQSPDIDPADKKMYALRDVTATVPSIPLIVASIISKKVAGGADAVVLDVKVGSGAFMKTEQDARDLAQELTRTGRALGKEVECIITDMDQPLGMAVGNALEVQEAIETLRGEGPAALTELCLVFGARMLVLGQVAEDEASARQKLEDSIASGTAIEAFESWVRAQGGDPTIAENPARLPQAAHTEEVRAESEGYVQSFDAESVGRAAMLLGAGRPTAEATIDPAAGILLDVRDGDPVRPGDRIATLFANDPSLFEESAQRLRHAISIGPNATEPPPLFHRA